MMFRSRCTGQLSEQEGPMVLMELTVIAWKPLRRHVVYREISRDTQLK
jgi:hypothetical protein